MQPLEQLASQWVGHTVKTTPASSGNLAPALPLFSDFFIIVSSLPYRFVVTHLHQISKALEMVTRLDGVVMLR